MRKLSPWLTFVLLAAACSSGRAAGTAAPTTTTPLASPSTSAACGPPAAQTRFLKARGFVVVDASDYSCETLNNPNEFPLHILIGNRGKRQAERAFFFVKGKYVGTDVPDTSEHVEIAWRNGTTIAVNYTIYKSNNSTCCPTGGAQTVRFAWTGTRLVARDPIPAAKARL